MTPKPTYEEFESERVHSESLMRSALERKRTSKQEEEIAEHKRTEDSLRDERNNANMYLDIAGVLLVAINTEGVVTLINRKGCEILGYEEKEICGKNWFDNFLPKNLVDQVKSISSLLLSGEIEPAEYFENPILKKHGEERLIAWRNTALRDGRGEIIGHFSSGKDITERKKAQDALRDNEQMVADNIRFRTNRDCDHRRGNTRDSRC